MRSCRHTGGEGRGDQIRTGDLIGDVGLSQIGLVVSQPKVLGHHIVVYAEPVIAPDASGNRIGIGLDQIRSRLYLGRTILRAQARVGTIVDRHTGLGQPHRMIRHIDLHSAADLIDHVVGG